MEYDSKGRITRRGMEKAIQSRGSVMHNGEIIASVDRLPSEAQLAAQTGDNSEVERVRRDNEAEIKRLQEENAQLKSVQPPKPAPDAKK